MFDKIIKLSVSEHAGIALSSELWKSPFCSCTVDEFEVPVRSRAVRPYKPHHFCRPLVPLYHCPHCYTTQLCLPSPPELMTGVSEPQPVLLCVLAFVEARRSQSMKLGRAIAEIQNYSL